MRFSKTFLPALFIIFLIVNGISAQDIVTVSGKLLGERIGGLELTVADPLQMPAQTFNTVTSADGGFSFKLPADNLRLYKISLTSDNYIMLITFPGENIQLNLSSLKLNNSPSIEGSEHTQLVYEIALKISDYDKQLDSLTKVYQDMAANPDFANELEELVANYQSIQDEKTKVLRQELLSHSGSPATLFFIDKLDIADDFDVYDAVAEALYTKYPDFKLVADLKQRTDIEKRLAVGNVVPEIELLAPDSTLIRLSSLRGKVVLIDFWASWCGPCRKDNPEVVKLYNRFKDKGFEIFGVSLDRDRDAWLNAISRDELTWTHVSDLKFWQSQAAMDFGVKSIPFTVLIDAEGRIIARRLRGKALESKLVEIFGDGR